MQDAGLSLDDSSRQALSISSVIAAWYQHKVMSVRMAAVMMGCKNEKACPRHCLPYMKLFDDVLLTEGEEHGAALLTIPLLVSSAIIAGCHVTTLCRRCSLTLSHVA